MALISSGFIPNAPSQLSGTVSYADAMLVKFLPTMAEVLKELNVHRRKLDSLKEQITSVSIVMDHVAQVMVGSLSLSLKLIVRLTQFVSG